MKVVPLYMVERYLDALDHAHFVSSKINGERRYGMSQRRGAWAEATKVRKAMLAHAADGIIEPDGPVCTWSEKRLEGE